MLKVDLTSCSLASTLVWIGVSSSFEGVACRCRVGRPIGR